ncbi:kinesin-like protein KIN-7E [Citrus sinensis]|uniref:Kinesin-like protein KIN-7E n=1 Tax=Citrus sinensis TaxID=2711 RepID=A0ACB8KRP9_CITSI|nr:kinesin-like protein KIN-7E [Citrus sinensis]
MSASSGPRRSSISPFRSRKSPAQPPPPAKPTGRPATPSSTTSSRPPSRLSASPATSVSHSPSPTTLPLDRPETSKSKENVMVTVRFRPLSPREVNKGDEIAWYADGDYTVRNEYNPSIAYGFDKVFGPATTTRHVYDVAAQHVVNGAMQGINGTVFAYGVTSSGKTHTMHGEQKSPGIIPLAVKDVFGIIQETPGREFLLRVSYLEIYNEVINDLLDPTGQNLRIREDAQGTYVEGIKEEVVLSPAHALSLIATGEEHRHVGSNNFNLLSSRSHTIFTLTIESSPTGENQGEEDVTLSQLLICTVTPASSNSEETHNTLKFAHRSKHVEIKASQNKIMDEKSLIKKYQKEITFLKQELQQLKSGMMDNPHMAASSQDDLVNLKLQAGQVKLQSRLEEEEQEKAALLGRIQRLTKLILVSTKNSMPSSIPERPGHRRRHSFGEDELAYLPDRKREYIIDDDAGSYVSELSAEARDDITNLDELVKDYKKNRRRGMLGWFKMRKPENLVGLSPSADSGSSSSVSPASSSKSLHHRVTFNDIKDGRRKSISKRGDDSAGGSFPERTKAGDLFSATVAGRRLPPMKMLAGEVALCTSSLKRLSEQAASNSEDSQLREHMQKLKDEISEKKLQIRVLEQRMIGSVERTPHTLSTTEMSQALSKLTTQLNEKTFELEIKSADNRILQEQLQMKISENTEMQETILLLRQQIDSLSNKMSGSPEQMAENDGIPPKPCSEEISQQKNAWRNGLGSCEETFVDEHTPTSVMSLNRIFSHEESNLNSQVLMQAAEIENLKQERVKLVEERDGLEIHSQKLAEEASYAKELASSAAVELRNLAEEVTRLSYENAKLNSELAAAKEALSRSNFCQRSAPYEFKQSNSNGARRKTEDGLLVEELQKELSSRYQREADLEAALSEREQVEGELRKRIDEAKRHEEDLENELANMWVLIAKMRNSGINGEDMSSRGVHALKIPRTGIKNGFMPSNPRSLKLSEEDDVCENVDGVSSFEELSASYQTERRKCKELESLISRLKGEDISGLDVAALEELQNFHVEAITKICHAKVTFLNFALFSELTVQ